MWRRPMRPAPMIVALMSTVPCPRLDPCARSPSNRVCQLPEERVAQPAFEAIPSKVRRPCGVGRVHPIEKFFPGSFFELDHALDIDAYPRREHRLGIQVLDDAACLRHRRPELFFGGLLHLERYAFDLPRPCAWPICELVIVERVFDPTFFVAGLLDDVG